MSLFNELQSLMIKYRFRSNKKLGQHFVINQVLIEKLVKLAGLGEKDTVLEIGPGTGFLTRHLLEKTKVVAVEIDEKFCELLGKEMPKENLTLLCGDFLKAELPKFNKVVSLPPYFQSSAITHKLLENDFELAVLVFQKEFAEKLVAFPGFAQYCALSVLTQHSFDANVFGTVSPNCFYPKPKDESSIVVLKAKEGQEMVDDKAGFAIFVKTLFRFRNKNLKNALQKGWQFLLPILEMEKAEFNKKLESLPLFQEKVDLIAVEDFAKVFIKLSKKI